MIFESRIVTIQEMNTNLSNHSYDFGAVYTKKLPKILIVLYPRHKQNQREATRNVKNNLEKKNNLKADNILP